MIFDNPVMFAPNLSVFIRDLLTTSRGPMDHQLTTPLIGAPRTTFHFKTARPAAYGLRVQRPVRRASRDSLYCADLVERAEAVRPSADHNGREPSLKFKHQDRSEIHCQRGRGRE